MSSSAAKVARLSERDLLDACTMLTVSRRVFSLRSPRPEDVDIEDIAHHLARLCRYGGAVQDHYSVAQHSVLVVQSLALAREPLEVLRWGLLHDAAEAYCGDFIRPLKLLMREGAPTQSVWDPSESPFDRVEARVQRAVCARFGLPTAEPDAVSAHDVAVCMREQFDLERVPSGWEPAVTPSPVRVEPWPFLEAKCRFLETYDELFQGKR